MHTTNTRPFPLVCGGVNALSPLNRNCNVLDDTCTPVDQVPIGAWWDGTALTWAKGKTLSAFGLPVMSISDLQTILPDHGLLTDSDSAFFLDVIDPVEISPEQILQGVIRAEPTPGNEQAIPGWEHYANFAYSTHISLAIAGAYALDNEPARVGLAARVFTPYSATTLQEDSPELFPASLGGKVFSGAVFFPVYAPGVPCTALVLDRDTMTEKRRADALIYRNNILFEGTGAIFGLYTDELNVDFDTELLSIDVDSLPYIDRVLHTAIPNWGGAN